MQGNIRKSWMKVNLYSYKKAIRKKKKGRKS